jgi:hypothetical protein
VEVMNDQKHYHIFSQKWIKDKRQRSFYINNLLQQIISHKDEAKHPILIVIEEVRVLLPEISTGFTPFLAKEIAENLAKMRNTGKGFSCLMTTQVYTQTHHEITAIAELVVGKLKSLREIDYISKTLHLNSTETGILTSIQTGEFVVRAKAEYDTEPSLQKIRMYLPPHAHNEVGTNFFEVYENKYPEKMRDYKDLIKEITKIKQETIDDVTILKDKENQMKNTELKKVREEKMTVQKDRMKIELAKIQNKTEKAEETSHQLKEAVYNEYINATGKDKTFRQIALKYNIKLSSGKPNHTQVKRIINEIHKEKTNEQNTNNNEQTQEKMNKEEKT